MKRSFFQAAVVSILLYRRTTWTLTKRQEKKLDGNYTRMLQGLLNKSRRQNSTKHQLYGHLPPITKTIKVWRTRHTGDCWRSRDELINEVPPHMAEQKHDDQLEPTYSSSVRIRNVALKTCQKRWTIRRSDERGSGIYALAVRHDDDDIYIYILCTYNFECELCQWHSASGKPYTHTHVYIYIYIYIWFQVQMNCYNRNWNTPYIVWNKQLLA